MKRFWAYIKQQRKTNTGIPPLKDHGRLVTDSDAKAEVFNSQFNSAFSAGRSYTQAEFRTRCKLSHIKENHPTMDNPTITAAGVEKLLAGLDPAKASGPDGISPRVLKELSHEISPALTIIYQQSLNTGEVPTDWKEAHVTPIYKKGEHYNPANYRPMSLTSVPCKILEHIIVSNMMQHLEENNILNDRQHGFRKLRSCETQLLELLDELTSSLDKGQQTDVIVIDFAKALDKVNHSLLCHKLDHYGIRNQSNTWISNFLNGRKQAVVVDGVKSDYTPVRSGVPQGSVLGPSLFLVYINDLSDRVDSPTRLLADDTILYRPISSTSDQQTLQEDLQKLEQWESDWDMDFHPDKCEVLSVSRRKTPAPRSYSLHGHTLKQVPSSKYLGVTLQCDGKFDAHVNNITTKANQTLGFLRRNLKIGSIHAKSLAYKALVRPLLEYASTVWDPGTKKEITKLEKVQRRAARFTLHRYHNTSSVDEMLHHLQWPTLEDRRKKARLSMMFKITNSLASVTSPDLIPQRTTHARRGHERCYRRSHLPDRHQAAQLHPKNHQGLE
eukprot:TRINITY_DN9988_c0_g1_i5.p1 TRINITY_DN9988_c0_g1~~TRINITY_DN9988_c0_g1_i5.p1  ORF type:complete len:555 (+),score=115.26 TRINITY_DN9988_c0_g1_i5:397-2061(+)